MFAGIYITLAAFHIELILNSVWFQILPVFVCMSYLIFARRYWIKVRLTGITVAALCFADAATSILIFLADT